MCSDRLRDKVAFITGGGSGIGRAIARSFVEEGATVCLAARNQENLASAVKEFEDMGGKALAIPMDILKEEDVINAVKKAIETFSRIDILVNNSGIGGPTAYVWDLKLDEWNEIIGVDLTGSMLCAREVLKHMVPAGKGGIIINIGAEGGRSGDGRSGYPMRAGYCCAKMGVIGLTETLARECGPHNIRVNCLSAGAVRGERFVRVMQGRADARGIGLEEMIKIELKQYSLGRPTEERELGQTAVFLASDESSAITGQTVVANCGMHMWG
ncbi:MAG TPA: SDR family oxidoreductase [Thermoleophilia bacterium]|nr:SDR family oxidoreductase [Thermoleophilia bacterium]